MPTNTETLGESIHRMQVEDRNVTTEQISAATTLGESSVWPFYSGWAFAEIERLRAENAQLKRAVAAHKRDEADRAEMERAAYENGWNARLPKDHEQACIEALGEARAEAIRWADLYSNSAPGRCRRYAGDAQRYANALAWLDRVKDRKPGRPKK